MNYPIEKMTVDRVVKQDNRTLLYPCITGDDFEYHVIANKDCSVQPGDVIEYEPYGFNFGWLVEAPKIELKRGD